MHIEGCVMEEVYFSHRKMGLEQRHIPGKFLDFNLKIVLPVA